MWLAIAETKLDGSLLESISPRIMRWSDDLWLVDLSPCWNYWNARAVAARSTMGGDVGVLLRRVLMGLMSHTNNLNNTTNALDHKSSDETAATPTDLARGAGSSRGDVLTLFGAEALHAALAPSPWQAVLLARTLVRDRRGGGLVTWSSATGERIREQLSWDVWQGEVEQLALHLSSYRRPRVHPPAVRSRLKQMLTAATRIGATTPSALREAGEGSMARRFGATLGEAWRWTWAEAASGTADAEGFPWVSLRVREPVTVERHLDSGVWQWDHLEALLGEDLDRLAAPQRWDAALRLVTMAWRLRLADLSEVEVLVRFRHPHPLANERGQHRTALAQAQLAYMAARRGTPLDPERYREGLEMPPVMGWQLTAVETMQLPARMQGLPLLFADEGNEAATADGLTVVPQALRDLENRLSIPLEAHGLCDDALPETSFVSVQTSHVAPERALGLSAMAASRPLMVFPRPRRLRAPAQGTLRRYLERISARWWEEQVPTGEGDDGCRSVRDYYEMTGPGRRSLWIFRNGRGEWFVHGVFA